MNKAVKPSICEVHGGRKTGGYAIIKYQNGRLSICGVVGPKSNGDSLGSCGQCIEEIRNGEPANGWTNEMLQRFCDIWEKWHLNDMRAYCEHQKELGWEELAKKKVTLYHYRLKREISQKQRETKDEAIKALKNGLTFTPSEEQVVLMNMPYTLVYHKQITEEQEKYYEPKKPLYRGDTGAEESKVLGWMRQEEHPDGILCRPCPVCGYKYGTSWKKEEVPEEVISFLKELPCADLPDSWW